MGKVTVNETSLKNIGNAIRLKLGVSSEYKPAQMASAIRSIPTPSFQSLTATDNGTYLPTSGHNAFDKVVVDVQGGGGSDTSDATLSSGSQMLDGITAYAKGSKYTGTIQTYTGSVNSGQGSIPTYEIYSGSYMAIPSTVSQAFSTAGKVLTQDFIVGSYSAQANLSDITITSNGSYSASSGYDGFSNVVVSVPQTPPPTLSDITIVSNGTYSAPDKGVDGFSNVTVSVPVKTLGSITVSENGLYKASDYSKDGFSRVTVNVPERQPNVVNIRLFSDGVFQASDFGFDGFDVITISIDSSYSEKTVISSGEFSGMTDIVIADFPEVTSVSDNAFLNCTNLVTVDMPLCSYVGYRAFGNCEKLKNVNLPMLESTGGDTFLGCKSLEVISLPSLSGIELDTFRNCYKLSSIYAPLVQNIGEVAFYRCSALKNVNFPSCSLLGLGQMGTTDSSYDAYSPFRYARLETISFPLLEKMSVSGCFAYQSELQSVAFPMCEYVSDYEFYSCTKLSVASFPKLLSIRSLMFYGCQVLSDLYLNGSSICTLQDTNAFSITPFVSNNSEFARIHVLSSLVAEYKSAMNWSAFSNCIVEV